MLKNIDFNIINKDNVLFSTVFLPFAIPFFGILLSLESDWNSIHSTAFRYVTLGLIFGAPIWFPSVIGCLIIESIGIRKNASKNTVKVIFIAEAIAAYLIFAEFFIGHSIQLFAAIAIAQLIRWIFLLQKGRLYNSAKSSKYDDINLDQ